MSKNKSILEYQNQESQPAGLAPPSVSSGDLYSSALPRNFCPEFANSSQGHWRHLLSYSRGN